MEIKETKFQGRDIKSIFTGNAYYFISEYYGIVAVANRRGYETDEDVRTFDIIVGNEHCTGGVLTNAVVYACVKKFVRKSENQFECHKVLFPDYTERDLSNEYLSITLKQY